MFLRSAGKSPPCHRHRPGLVPRLRSGRGRTAVAWLIGGFSALGLDLSFALAANEIRPDAHHYAISLYNVYDGLPANSAPVTRQTRDGYLWVGTELGLSRFDGVRFVNFRVTNTPELGSNLIRTLFEDDDGWLWIATQGGLARQRDGKFERVGFEGTPVIGIGQDSAGTIWIGTADRGLWSLRNGQLVSQAEAPGMQEKWTGPVASLLYLDSRQRVWFGPSNDLRIFDRHAGQPAFSSAPPFQNAFRVAETPAGVFWLDTDKGLFRLKDGVYRRFGVEEGLGGDVIRNLLTDRKGRLWVFMNSLYLLENAATDRFVRVILPGVENPRSVMEDAEGSYWIGTAGDGVARLRSTSFHMLTPENGLLGGNTRTVAIDREGNVWAGLATSGVARIQPDGTMTTIVTGDAAVGEVWSVLPAADGRVWIGTRTSLRIYFEGKQELLPQYQRIRSLFEASDGTIWIGSENEGLIRYRNGVFTPMVEAIKAKQPDQRSPLPLIPMAFAEDAEGTIYVGLREAGGLVKIKDDVITVFSPSKSVPTSEIRAIYPDRDGHLWLGTKGHGLSVLIGDHWYNPSTLSEPLNDLVSSILEDEKGQLWIGTPQGLVWAPKADFLALARGEITSAKFRRAVESDGVRPAVVGAGSFPGAAKAPDGTLWFGSRRGLLTVEPHHLSFNQIPPPVRIEEAWVENKITPFTDEIRLPAGSRSLTINYTAPSFVAPNRVQFRYRLEGHDQEWTEAGTRRTAFYTNLGPGSYHFRVIACNEDGVWNEKGATIRIVQLPFFYQTGWFYGVVVLGLAGIILAAHRWRTAALKRRNQELEQGIIDRTAELAKSYEAIRASEYFYHSLVESLPQIIVRKDVEGRFTYANAGFGELIGRPLDQVIGKGDADLYPPEQAEKFRADDRRAIQTHQTLEYETIAERKGQPPRYLHVKKVPLFNQQGGAMGVQILFWDMTTFREIEEKLKQAQHELVETSRLAGIAEMATGILHNLGNALNSVNTTANLAVTRLRRSKLAFVSKTAQLLTENSDRLPEFFSSDPRGSKLPSYLAELANHLESEHRETLVELEGLQASVDHIKELVASQQQHAKVSGVSEAVSPTELVEHALRVGEAALKRHDITVVREFVAVPPVKVERQKVLQIIGNMITNASDALEESTRPDKRIALGVRGAAEGRVQIYITDNGVGIAPENLTRIFAFGFTTKKNSHAFGLHASALAAKEIGGSLNGFSDGPGRGATFVLELATAKD